MSRKCPKKNYLFLNWLKANRSRFTIVPHIVRIRRHAIDLAFTGVSPALKFCLEFTDSGGPWISVDIKQPDGNSEGIVRFYGAEYKSSENIWTSLKQRPEERRHWDTREEVWIAMCFEQFLIWCNENLSKTDVSGRCRNGC